MDGGASRGVAKRSLDALRVDSPRTLSINRNFTPPTLPVALFTHCVATGVIPCCRPGTVRVSSTTEALTVSVGHDPGQGTPHLPLLFVRVSPLGRVVPTVGRTPAGRATCEPSIPRGKGGTATGSVLSLRGRVFSSRVSRNFRSGPVPPDFTCYYYSSLSTPCVYLFVGGGYRVGEESVRS